MGKPKNTPLDPAALSEIFEIDPSSPTGLRWKSHPSRKKLPNVKDDVAGAFSKRGYAMVMLCGKKLQVHRVVWAIRNQKDPGELTVDHIDRNRGNNSPDNLRLATRKGQSENRKTKKYKYPRGVRKIAGRYYGEIRIDGRRTCIKGGFDTPEEAGEAVERLRLELAQTLQSEFFPDPEKL